MTAAKEGSIRLVRPWSANWHAEDRGPSGRGECGWAHEDVDRPAALWTVVVDRPDGKNQDVHAMCDACLARATELYGEPRTWRRA
jgi:hypothetical protein